jgi:enamine deaminase RidA (YjgF/YER057c/UK114 family)
MEGYYTVAVHNVKALCEATLSRLKDAVTHLESFLNHHSLEILNPERDAAMEEFYKDFLSDMRHLLVFSELACEKLGICLRRRAFNVEFAEKVLYDVYHNCINGFFYPKNECYSEDGRYAYTGQDAIRFRKKPIRAVRDITIGLSKLFEELREDLAYYETDYVTQKRMQGENI